MASDTGIPTRSISIPVTRNAYWIYHALACREGHPAKPRAHESLSSLGRASAAHRPHPLHHPTRSFSCKKHPRSRIAIPMRLYYLRRSHCRACRSRLGEVQLRAHSVGTRTLRHRQPPHRLLHDGTPPPLSRVQGDRCLLPTPAEDPPCRSPCRMQHTWRGRQHDRRLCLGHRAYSQYGKSLLHALLQRSSVVAVPACLRLSPGHPPPRPANRRIYQTGGQHIRRTRPRLAFSQGTRDGQPLLLRRFRWQSSIKSVVARCVFVDWGIEFLIRVTRLRAQCSNRLKKYRL